MRNKDSFKMAQLMENMGINRKTTVSKENLKYGLAPWVGENPLILILGTLPGDISIKTQAYYQNKGRNSFWKIMHALWPNDASLSDEDFVKKHHIALWDCLHSAERMGSTDDNFGESMIPNDLQDFLNNHTSIRTIILNGTKDTTDFFFNTFGRFIKSVK